VILETCLSLNNAKISFKK